LLILNNLKILIFLYSSRIAKTEEATEGTRITKTSSHSFQWSRPS